MGLPVSRHAPDHRRAHSTCVFFGVVVAERQIVALGGENLLEALLRAGVERHGGCNRAATEGPTGRTAGGTGDGNRPRGGRFRNLRIAPAVGARNRAKRNEPV